MSPDARSMIIRYLNHALHGVKLADTMELFAAYLGQQMRPLSPRRRNNALAEMRRLIQGHIDQPPEVNGRSVKSLPGFPDA